MVILGYPGEIATATGPRALWGFYPIVHWKYVSTSKTASGISE
jgi:hypothetical protein